MRSRDNGAAASKTLTTELRRLLMVVVMAVQSLSRWNSAIVVRACHDLHPGRVLRSVSQYGTLDWLYVGKTLIDL